MTDAPEAPQPSATILLVRDGSAGLEVFMVQRSHQIDFVAGAMVFPGGKVSRSDASPELANRCTGIEGLDAEARIFRVAAIRETFEECGVLLARQRGETELLDAERLREIDQRYRAPLLEERIGLEEIASEEDLELAADQLVPFAHWITPAFMRRRFDTHFFLVQAPARQLAVHDGGESVDSIWITPGEAVAAAETGRRTIIFPTLLNLKKLGASPSVSEALEAAYRSPVVTVLPRLERRPGGDVMRLPADAGYGLSEAPLSELGPLPTAGPKRGGDPGPTGSGAAD